MTSSVVEAIAMNGVSTIHGMSESDVNLSELTKTRKLIAKKFEQSVKERAKREERECDTLPNNSDVNKSCPIRMTTTTVKNDDDHDVESKEDESANTNSFGAEVDTADLPISLKRYVIRSTKTNGIKVTPSSSSLSTVSSNRRETLLRSFDANGLCNRLRLLISGHDEGIPIPQNYHEIDSILSKLRELQVIL